MTTKHKLEGTLEQIREVGRGEPDEGVFRLKHFDHDGTFSAPETSSSTDVRDSPANPPTSEADAQPVSMTFDEAVRSGRSLVPLSDVKGLEGFELTSAQRDLLLRLRRWQDESQHSQLIVGRRRRPNL